MFWSLAAGLVGSVIQRSNQKRQYEQQRALNEQTAELNQPDYERIRDDAQKAGFNPMSALTFGGSHMGNQQAPAVPPLASNDFLANAIMDFADQFSPEAQTRRATAELNRDLAQIKLDQARSGVIAAAPSAAASMPGGAVLGRSNTVTQGTVTAGNDLSPITPKRATREEPTSNIGGVVEIQNKWTGDRPIYLPGSDGEVMDAGQALVASVVGGPQVAWGWYSDRIGQPFAKWYAQNVGQPVADFVNGAIDNARTTTPYEAESDAIYRMLEQDKPEWMRTQ